MFPVGINFAVYSKPRSKIIIKTKLTPIPFKEYKNIQIYMCVYIYVTAEGFTQ